MDLTLYYIPISPPCWSVLLLGHQLDLRFKLQPIDFKAKEHLSENFVKLNPAHTVPTLVDGDFVLGESRAILSYLMDAYTSGDHSMYPREAKARAVVQHRLNFDLGTLYQRFIAYCSPQWKSGTAGSDADREKLEEALDVLEVYLSRSAYSAGDHLTIADVSLFVSVSALDLCYFNRSKYAKVAAWYDTVKKELVGYEDVIGSKYEEFQKFVTHPAKKQE